jgi:cytochrome c oxidase subunit III
MATTIHEPPGRAKSSSRSGNDGWSDLPPVTGSLLSVEDSSPASRTGIWVGLAAITMTFAAFTSALVVREGSSNDWLRFSLPPVLYLNTLLLLASSLTLEISRRKFALFTRHLSGRPSAPLLWLYVTLGLGLMFVIGQYMAWLQLKAAGLYLATNPSASFFYVLTAAHAIHVLGGLCGLVLVIFRLRKRVPTLRRSSLNAVSYYWHFMDILWLYLLSLLWLKL